MGVNNNVKSFNFINTNNLLHFFIKAKIQRENDGCLASQNVRLRGVSIRYDCFASYSCMAYDGSFWVSFLLSRGNRRT